MSLVYNKILSKGLEENLPDIINGKIRITTDTHRLFVDNNDERFEISDFINNLSEEEIKNLNNPLPKFYLSSDTNTLYFGKETKCIPLMVTIAEYANKPSQNAVFDFGEL